MIDIDFHLRRHSILLKLFLLLSSSLVKWSIILNDISMLLILSHIILSLFMYLVILSYIFGLNLVRLYRLNKNCFYVFVNLPSFYHKCCLPRPRHLLDTRFSLSVGFGVRNMFSSEFYLVPEVTFDV